jgi:hypothetical protein
VGQARRNDGHINAHIRVEEAANKAAAMLKANPPGGDAITINSIEIGEVVERV